MKKQVLAPWQLLFVSLTESLLNNFEKFETLILNENRTPLQACLVGSFEKWSHGHCVLLLGKTPHSHSCQGKLSYYSEGKR